ncbi:hypothetical protein ACFLRW_01335 [Acidobacteriota bacterium]
MKKTKKKLWTAVKVIVLLFFVVILVAALFFYLNKPLLKNILEGYAYKKYGMKLDIGTFDFKLFPFRASSSSVLAEQKSDIQNLDASIDRLTITGNLWKAMRNKRPYLEMVEIENLSVQIQQKISAEFEFKDPVLLLADALSFTAAAMLRNVSYNLTSSSQDISFSSADFDISKTNVEDPYSFDIEIPQMLFKSMPQNTSLKCGIIGKGTIAFSDLSVLEGFFSFSELEASRADKKVNLDILDLAVNGEYEQKGRVVSISKFEAKIPSFVEASGSARVNFSPRLSLSVDSEIFLLDVQLLFEAAQPFLSQSLEGVSLQGQAEIRGKVSVLSSASGRTIDISGTAKLLPAELDYTLPGLSFKSSIFGEIEAKGAYPDMEFSGQMEMKDGSLINENIEVRGIFLQLPFRGKGLEGKSRLFKGTINNVTFMSGDHTVAADTIDFGGTGHYDADSTEIFLDSLDVKAPKLPAIHIEAKAQFTPMGEKGVKIVAEEVEIAQAQSLFLSFVPKQLADWTFSGRSRLDMELQQSSETGGKNWKIDGTLELSEFLFQDPDFTLAGENLRPSLSWTAEYSTASQQADFSVSFSLDAGESLWKDRYVSWGQNPVSGKMSGLLRMPQKELNIHSMEVHFSPFGRTALAGTVNYQQPYTLDLHGSAELALESFDPGFFGLQSSWQEKYRMKGQAQTDFFLAVSDNFLKVSGELFVKDGSFENVSSGLSAEGVETRIPFEIETGGKDEKMDRASLSKNGYFKAKTLKTPYFKVQPFVLDISSGRNMFLIEPFSIGLFGGTAAIGESVLSVDPDRATINGISSLVLEGIDVSQFPIKSDLFHLEGTAKGIFPQVNLALDQISATGTGVIAIFGGTALIENTRIFSPFSEGRTVSMDILFDNFNIEKITDALPFGKVTGILKGEIKGLAISYEQPESFNLHLESVKTKGVPQLFSLKAVNDLTVLSSGENSSMSTFKGLAGIVPNFPYARIGISSTLDNDTFTISGAIKEGTTEYLVKRPWLVGINVINRNPGKKISFKDMRNRLERIGKSSQSK